MSYALITRVLVLRDFAVTVPEAIRMVRQMNLAYEEIVDFIAKGPSSNSVADFEASPETKTRVENLIHREKNEGISEEERAELDTYMVVEHVMRMAKARARLQATHD